MSTTQEQLLRAICVPPDATIRDGMEAINRGAVEIALVVDGAGILLGTVTDGDIRRALLAGHGLDDSRLEVHMNRHFASVGPREGRNEVLDLMRARKISQVPIVEEDGMLAGLHTMGEVVGARDRPNRAVVMAGGRGTRLHPITETIPKPMIPVAGRPILERIILHLAGYGISQVYVALNYMRESIEEHFGDGSAFGCSIEYLRETTPLGTAGALSLIPERLEHSVLVLNGDLVTQFSVDAMLRFHDRSAHVATIGIRQYAHTVPYGVVQVEEDRVTGLIEKPTRLATINTGIYVLSPVLLERVPTNTPFDMPTLLDECLTRGESVGAFTIEDDWVDVGQHDELKQARGEVA